jgi:hypothetical protein
MPDLIILTVDVTKIDKGRLIPSKKEGSTAKYLELVLMPKNEPDEWGNEWSVVQGISKEDRERGVKAPFIGRAKRPMKKASTTPPQQRPSGGPSAKHTAPVERDDDKDVPF